MFSFLLGKHLGVKVFSLLLNVHLKFSEMIKLFLQQLYHFAFLPAMYDGISSSEASSGRVTIFLFMCVCVSF